MVRDFEKAFTDYTYFMCLFESAFIYMHISTGLCRCQYAIHWFAAGEHQ